MDNKTLAITEIPYGKTTSSVIDSILKAVDKGKIKIRKVDDNTAANVSELNFRIRPILISISLRISSLVTSRIKLG